MFGLKSIGESPFGTLADTLDSVNVQAATGVTTSAIGTASVVGKADVA